MGLVHMMAQMPQEAQRLFSLHLEQLYSCMAQDEEHRGTHEVASPSGAHAAEGLAVLQVLLPCLSSKLAPTC